MRVFVSWSGDRSKVLASALAEWLPRVLPLVGTSISESIPAGTEWRTVLMEKLKKCDAIVACLTPENVRSQWLNFEAGAAASMLDYRLFPVFLGDDPLPPGPLSGLQVMRFNENDLRHLVHRLNSHCEPNCPEAWVNEQFSLLWKDLATRIGEADRSWIDYDDAMDSIREHLKELERLMQVNVITFYVRDYAAPKDAIDFYLEATHGLRDPAPMYGPVVFDDYRTKRFAADEFDSDMGERMKKAIDDKVETRARTFIGREKILSGATFRHPDSDGGVKALLHLNWRSKQEFSSQRKDELREHAAAVFRLLPRRPSISIERARLLTKELRARRYLDTVKADTSLGDTIRGAIGQFFERDQTTLAIELCVPDKARHAVDPNWKWVYTTTKPLFLKSDDEYASIVVPMRIPPRREKCKGVIVISERGDGRDQLKPQMVRPLCSLADTFGGMPGGLK